MLRRRDPEDLGPRQLGLGDPGPGLRRGHDQRPGVGEPQGGGQVDREAEIGRREWRGVESRAGGQGRRGRHRSAGAGRRRPHGGQGRGQIRDDLPRPRIDGRGRCRRRRGRRWRVPAALAHEAIDVGGHRRRQQVHSRRARRRVRRRRGRGLGHAGGGLEPGEKQGHGEDRWPGGACLHRTPHPVDVFLDAVRRMGRSCRYGSDVPVQGGSVRVEVDEK